MKFAPIFLLVSATTLLALESPKSRGTISPVAPMPAISATPPDTQPFTKNPTGGGLAVDGIDGQLVSDTSISVTFPREMVSADKIDAEDVESPIVAWPQLDVAYSWSTQTEGYLSFVGPFIPNQTYRFRLREGLKDLAGNPLPTDAWGFEMTTPELRVVEDGYGEREKLNSRPQIPLEFNYPIRLSDAAQGIWMQDRATRKRFPVEILLNRPTGEIPDKDAVAVTGPVPDTVTDFRVRPVKPLPLGGRYDLVIDGVCDAFGGRTLPYPKVFPLGTTQPLDVSYVMARNFPLENPQVEVKFAQMLGDDPLPENALMFSPAVPNLKVRKDNRYLIAEGDFNTTTRYTVTINPNIIGVGGYGLAGPQKWGATFRPKQSALLFPANKFRERSALGLTMAFYQLNTSELEWKLAPIPLDKLNEANERDREFVDTVNDENGNPEWTEDGLFRYEPSEPLIPALGLTPIASGKIAADMSGQEVLRNITWKPENPATLEGPMLVEVTGKDEKGRVIGNRAIIYFGEAALTRKVTKDETIVRAARMSNGEPIANATISVLDGDMKAVGSAVTDVNGVASWKQTAIPTAAYFLAKAGGVSTLQPVGLTDQFSSGSPSTRQPATQRGYIFTDRPLYRPGQTVQFKGILRQEVDGILKAPANTQVKWVILPQYNDQVLAEGTTKTDANGSWNGSWTPPEDAATGSFEVKALIDGVQAGWTASFKVEEFRNPLFSVVCEAKEDLPGPAQSIITVDSQYFHGAPNVGSKVTWTATWVSDSSEGYYEGDSTGMTRVDLFSENVKTPTYIAEASGEAALDGNGQVTLTCKTPFADPGNRANCYVSWKVDVTGPDGQTITGGASQTVPMAKALLGVKSEDDPKKVIFHWDSKSDFDAVEKSVNVKLFHVVTKSVKERVAKNVYRYRNFDQYVPIEERKGVTDDKLEFTPTEPGRYVLVASPVAGAPGFPVSADAYLSGDEESEVPVKSDSNVTVFSVNGAKTDDTPWKVGETAVLNVLSPTDGIAWVSVETDKVLDTFTVPIKGNTSRLEIPVKPEYEPNVFVSVYLLKPGEQNELAGEMFGYASLKVMAPDRKLDVAVSTTREDYEPREKVVGEVRVTANGQPVANADLAIYAVDDSVLTLGGWQLPAMMSCFFPERSFGVATYSALKDYLDKIDQSWLTMKGFVAGDGGADTFGNTTFTRKEFKPIIFWKPNVKTDAKGVAKFDCEAPDNLTRFRVIAVGQTKESQFGGNSSTFEVSKKLLIDPALPRFVREGDEVELRAVARQKVSPHEKLTVRCSVTGGLELTGPPQLDVSADKDAPAVVRFKARATTAGPGAAKFQVVAASDPKLADAVEVSVPVDFPVILKKESVAGTVGNTTFAPREVAPSDWENARGTFDFAVSTTPWLPKLMGLPYLLEYPHGCLEQKSSKLLGYTYLADLLVYLPDADTRKANYEHTISETLKEAENSLLPDGRLPYWPGGVTANDFVTIQMAWCVGMAEAAGVEVPEHLASELPEGLNKIANGGSVDTPASMKAFALFVLSTFEGVPEDEVKAAANDLFLKRDKLTGEGRAMLAIALSNWEINPDEQKQLVAELPSTFDKIEFNPETFSSATRTEALCTWARLVITPEADAPKLTERLNKLLESSASLSTQENLWLLVAFDAMLKGQTIAKISSAKPKPTEVSANGSAVSWTNQDLTKLAELVVNGLPAPRPPGSFVLSAAYRAAERTTPLVIHGMKVERVVKNLTDAKRDGSAGAPFKLGDQILISYRFSSDRAQSYVALEDMLPAGLEVVNPNLALFGAYYDIPAQSGETADLSHSEMRDKQTNLYFDELPAGQRSYSVLARATAAGTFIWPATQIMPMYDSRFYGRSPSSICAVSSE